MGCGFSSERTRSQPRKTGRGRNGRPATDGTISGTERRPKSAGSFAFPPRHIKPRIVPATTFLRNPPPSLLRLPGATYPRAGRTKRRGSVLLAGRRPAVAELRQDAPELQGLRAGRIRRLAAGAAGKGTRGAWRWRDLAGRKPACLLCRREAAGPAGSREGAARMPRARQEAGPCGRAAAAALAMDGRRGVQ